MGSENPAIKVESFNPVKAIKTGGVFILKKVKLSAQSKPARVELNWKTNP